MALSVTANRKLMIGGKFAVLESTMMLDWSNSCLTLPFVSRKTSCSDEQVTLEALTNIMSSFMILQLLFILIRITACLAF